MASKVAIVRCSTYEADEVQTAVERALGLLGGVEEFVRPGERILLKPNLLVGATPESAVTTHPSVFAAVVRVLQGAGATLTYGDSPGFGSTAGAARKAGIAQVAEDLGVALADFSDGQQVSFPEGRLIKQFFLAIGVLEADGVVSLPKFKTHGLTRITAAVKNQFGCVVGLRKGEWHARMPDVERFCQMLVDLNRCIAPRLSVCDAVVAMEGNGPRSGTPRPVGAIVASADPVALDATLARIVGLDPALVGTIVYGEEFGLGTASDVELVGDPLEEFVVPDFEVNRSPASTTGGSKGPVSFMRRFVVPKPVIRPDRCTACGTCVRVCPVTPKAVDWATPGGAADGRPPRHDYGRCIRCYCCQEMCPEGAIQIEVPPLGRIIHRGS
ncbi:MAG: DUF362 domain-containing protein [Anaerosomatales bacterium]|nr:DUF362 domain-containing protein [Anaerosomatales bacterium]